MRFVGLRNSFVSLVVFSHHSFFEGEGTELDVWLMTGFNEFSTEEGELGSETRFRSKVIQIEE